MKNFVLFPPLNVIRRYQVKCAVLLTSVPVLCIIILVGLMMLLGELNLYYLENSGMMISEEIRRAYHERVEIELYDVAWYVGLLVALTFGVSLLIMNWAISPFVNAERVLRKSAQDPNSTLVENDWLSESPAFHHAIWTLAKKARDRALAFELPEVKYRFTFAFFFKFVVTFYIISVITSYVSGILLSTAYLKIINMAISLVRLNQRSHYLLAQEQILSSAITVLLIISCVAYAIIGYYITRYLSNMLFVFTRALREHHFPLRLRHSDIYHGLADAITIAAETAGLEPKNRK